MKKIRRVSLPLLILLCMVVIIYTTVLIIPPYRGWWDLIYVVMDVVYSRMAYKMLKDMLVYPWNDKFTVTETEFNDDIKIL